MSLFTLRTGATAHPEDSVLQFTTDFIVSSGVVSRAAGTTHLLVQAQASPDMTVKVKAGRAYIKGVGSNAYPVISDADTSVAISSNGSGSSRIDALVLYIDKSASANSDASNIAKLVIVQGTTSTPNDSAIQSAVGASNPFLRLANVTVGSGVTSITGGNIADTRVTARFQLSDLSVQDGMVDFEEQSTAPSAPSSGVERIYSKTDKKLYRQTGDGIEHELVALTSNLIRNGNFVNNSTNGYGSTPDDWSSTSANPVQGGYPALTKQDVIDTLGVLDSDIKGLWNLNGNFNDLSSSGYNLTPTNSPTDSSDGLMALAKQFSAASTQYASIADASSQNLEMAGQQTWFALVKPTIAGTIKQIMCKHKLSSTGTRHELYIGSDNTFGFSLKGLTTTDVVTSSVKMEANKWYFVVGRYDGSTLSITVNGFKTASVASGSAGDSNADFIVGADKSNTSDSIDHLFNGLIQTCCVLGVALTDSQVNRLWSLLSYRGLKIRRSGSNGEVYEDLTDDQVIRLRGKVLTVRADIYQGVASTAQISIDDGTETLSNTDPTINQWIEGAVTKKISNSANRIRVRIKHSTTDGNTWFKQVGLYVSGHILPFAHSADDWARFPMLLRQTPPTAFNGYSYEENRIFSYVPAWYGYSANPSIGNGSILGTYQFKGRECDWRAYLQAGSTTAFGTGSYFLGLPALPNPLNHRHPIAEVHFSDYGLNSWLGDAYYDVVYPDRISGLMDVGTTNGAVGGWAPTSPFTMGVNDFVAINGHFQM